MTVHRNKVDETKFNESAELPFELRLEDFRTAMQDIYDFLYDVNSLLSKKGLRRLDDMLRAAAMSGILSDMIAASLANHSQVLTENRYFNGHPDLIVNGIYPDNAVQSGADGIEVKTTRRKGGAFVYRQESSGIALRAILKYRLSLSTPMLRYPTASAAASVEPAPAKGSRITPFPSGRTPRTTWRKKAWGFKLG